MTRDNIKTVRDASDAGGALSRTFREDCAHTPAVLLAPELVARPGQDLQALCAVLFVQRNQLLCKAERHGRCRRNLASHSPADELRVCCARAL